MQYMELYSFVAVRKALVFRLFLVIDPAPKINKLSLLKCKFGPLEQYLAFFQMLDVKVIYQYLEHLKIA